MSRFVRNRQLVLIHHWCRFDSLEYLIENSVDSKANEEWNFLYHVLICVYVSVDVGCLNEIQVLVNVGWEDDLHWEVAEIYLDELVFRCQKKNKKKRIIFRNDKNNRIYFFPKSDHGRCLQFSRSSKSFMKFQISK